MDAGLELWRDWFGWNGDPWHEPNAGQVTCFFCGGDEPSHNMGCVFIAAKNMLNLQFEKDMNEVAMERLIDRTIGQQLTPDPEGDTDITGHDEDLAFFQSFYVDDGELDDLDKTTCFALGVEFSNVLTALRLKDFPFEIQIHSENEDRIRKMLADRGANYEIQPHDDWPLLIILSVGL